MCRQDQCQRRIEARDDSRLQRYFEQFEASQRIRPWFDPEIPLQDHRARDLGAPRTSEPSLLLFL